jgi:hypothetical protein
MADPVTQSPTSQVNTTQLGNAQLGQLQTTDPVANAKATIEDRMEGTGFFGDRTAEDSQAILDTINSLPAEEASQLIKELQAEGKLDDIAAMVTDGTWVVGDGVSQDARLDFFADMAKKVDGEAAAALSQAFGAVGQGSGTAGGKPDSYAGADYAREIGQAMAAHASADDKVAFVEALAPHTVDEGHDSQFNATWTGGEARLGNAQAGAVGEVLGSLSGEHAKEAFKALNSEQMEAVYVASIDARTTTGMGGSPGAPSVNIDTRFDTAGFDRIAAAAASIDSADPESAHIKAQVFAAGTEVIKHVRIDNTVLAYAAGLDPASSQGAVAGMANSLAKIIDSDPHGVVRDLREFVGGPSRPGETRTEDGSALATYAKAMIQSGEEGRGKLGSQLGQIAAGEGQASLTDAFNSQVGGVHETAESLGYFVGAVAAASKSIDENVEEQRKLIGQVFDAGMGVVDKHLPETPVNGMAKDWLKSALESLVNNPGSDLAADLFYAAVPDENGYGTAQSGPYAAFQSSMKAVEDFAKP